MKKRKDPRAAVYQATSYTFLSGAIRLHNARIATLCASVAISKAHSTPLPEPDDHPLWSVLKPLLEIEPREYDSFLYLSDLVYIVYGTTLFDTFLSETTRFLFLNSPAALGDDSQLKLEAVLRARSRFDVLNFVVEKRVRDISFQSFRERLRFLKERFGLRFSLPSTVAAALEHYSSVRNTIVHDQGFLELFLNARGKIAARQVRCSRHPTAVSASDLPKALDAYKAAMALVHEAVLEQVLHQPHSNPNASVSPKAQARKRKASPTAKVPRR